MFYPHRCPKEGRSFFRREFVIIRFKLNGKMNGHFLLSRSAKDQCDKDSIWSVKMCRMATKHQHNKKNFV